MDWEKMMKLAAAALALLGAVGGGFLYLEGRFVRMAHAEERHTSLYHELQVRDLKTKIELAELELLYLDPDDPADEREVSRLERKIDVLQKHLLELEAEVE